MCLWTSVLVLYVTNNKMQVERDKNCEKVEEASGGAICVNASDNKDTIYGSNLSLSESSSSSSLQDDDDDSLELSESESITDVTPLNSPYCDSPMPQTKDRLQPDSGNSGTNPREMNVLMQAIEKLEIEKNRKTRKQRNLSDHSRRSEPENQKLFKQALSQQNRAKKASQDKLCRRSTVINRYKINLDSESPIPSDAASKALPSRYSSRKQKCLSHPSCQPYAYCLPENQHPCGLASKTAMQNPNASAEASTDVETEMIAH